MPPKSDVWKFFEKSSHNYSKCKLCFKLIKTSGNTSNLKSHLKTHSIDTTNKSVTTSDQNGFSPAQKSNTDSDISNCSMNLDDSCSSEVLTIKRQRSIEEVFSSISTFNEGGSKYLKVTNAILYMICRDYQPISIVDNYGFRNLIKALSGGSYKIPSRTTIMNLLDKKYEEISNVFKKTIRELRSYCLTTDVWTDTMDVWTDTMQTRSFLRVTMHFEQNSQIKGVTLGVFEMKEKHTSVNIIDELNKVFEVWSINDNNITAVVSDGDKNITKALETMFGSNKHLHCLMHQINLVVQNSIKSVEVLGPLLKKIKDIVTWFKYNVNASDELRKSQSSSCTKMLIQAVPTRWNSLFHMIARFLDLSDVINQILNRYPSAPFMVSAKELHQLKEIKTLLHPFEAATKEIEGKSYVPSSLVIPMLFNLQQQIIHTTEELKYDVWSKLKSALLQECKRRFHLIEEHKVLAISTLLDPRFKKMYFNSTEFSFRVIQEVNRMLLENAAQNLDQLETLINASIKAESEKQSNTGSYSLWKHHTNLVRQNTRTLVEGSNNNLSAELNLFLNSPVVSLATNPLIWWDSMSTTYPMLTKIAIKYLAIVATSVPSERLFSKVGQTMTQQRNRIKGKHLSKLLFLQSIDETFWDL